MPVELEHKPYWAVRKLNLDEQAAGRKRMLQLHELEEFQLLAYESAKLYKEKVKRWYDRNILLRKFEEGQNALLFNSRLRFFPGKLKSKWSRPFQVTAVFPHGAVELIEPQSGRKFKVNGQRLKHYWGGDINREQTSISLHEL